MKSSVNNEGLGSKTINSDIINRQEAEDLIKKYAASDNTEDLCFSSELGHDERKEIAMVAQKYKLLHRKVMKTESGRRRLYLVISKKMGAEYILEQLEREGSWGRYQLVNPAGGDKHITSQYLKFQHLRKTQVTDQSQLSIIY